MEPVEGTRSSIPVRYVVSPVSTNTCIGTVSVLQPEVPGVGAHLSPKGSLLLSQSQTLLQQGTAKAVQYLFMHCQ